MTEIKNPMFSLFRYLSSYKQRLWFSVFSSVSNKIIDLMPPFITAWIIDTVSGKTPGWIPRLTGLEETWDMLLFLSLLTLIIFGLESLLEWQFKRGFMQLAQEVQHDLRMDAYSCLQKREIAFFETQRTGNLMAILNDDINQLERFLNNSFNEILQLITLFIFAGWALCNVSLQLGIIGMSPIPFIIVGSFFYQKKISPYYKKIREAVGRLGTRLENNLSGILVIKSFAAEDYEYKRMEKVSAQYRNANFRAIQYSSIYIPIIRMFIAIGFAAVLLLASYQILNGKSQITLGQLAFFAMMIQRLLWPVTTLGRVFDEFERARASAGRVFGLLQTKGKIQSVPDAKKLSRHAPIKIDLEHISFAYFKELPIIRELNLSIPSASSIGIAGPTGAGKTTLIKLLLRLYDVDNGRILLDGTDIRNIDLKSLRQSIALVSQDVYLFHGTIAENISYGNHACSIESIKSAAKKARLDDFIDQLPLKYDTIVGERGIKLSGGQRQRLSIARAILKDAPILILDEATSSVDTETERAIQQNLARLIEGKTAIIIAHRLSTIRHADQIILMKDGKIHESGTHESLLQIKGLYADLWNVQIGALEI